MADNESVNHHHHHQLLPQFQTRDLQSKSRSLIQGVRNLPPIKSTPINCSHHRRRRQYGTYITGYWILARYRRTIRRSHHSHLRNQ